MSNFARDRDLDLDNVRQAGRDLGEIGKLYTELGIDIALGIAGVAPGVGWAADAVSLGRSYSKGDGWGMLFDVIGFVPLIGDGIKGIRLADKLNDVRRILDDSVAGLARTFRQTQDAAADFWRSKRNMTAYNDAMRSCGGGTACMNAAALHKGPQYAQTPTSNGNWFPPDGRGDGVWTPDANSPLGSVLANGNPPSTGIRYENGFPQFDDFSQGNVQIPMTGSNARDRALADDLYRRQIDDAEWIRPSNMTWHHKEDGTTMQLIPTQINNLAGHTGGAALFREGNALGSEF